MKRKSSIVCLCINFIGALVLSSANASENQYIDIEKCIPFSDSVLHRNEQPQTPGEIVPLAEKFCKKGSKMSIEDIPYWWTTHVIYNVCDMKFSYFVDKYGTEEEPKASIVCIYEGKYKVD
tara:strand:- start:115 stop:477 length:363 start_codon:yes stop_codon:yes gene_type:complete